MTIIDWVIYFCVLLVVGLPSAVGLFFASMWIYYFVKTWKYFKKREHNKNDKKTIR
jgi:hypothetical protein